MVDAQKLFEVVDRHNQAEYEGDLEATMATVGPDPDFHIYPLGLHLTTREEVAAYYKGLYDAGFKEYDANVRNRWAVDGETVVVEVDVEVWIKGDFMGVKLEEAQKVRIPQIAILTIRDGLVAGERSYFDLHSILQQVQGGQEEGGGAPTIQERNKALVRLLFEAMSASDTAAVGALLADDVRWELPYHPDHSSLSGAFTRDGILGLLAELKHSMPGGLHFTLHALTAEDDRVAVEAESHAETPVGTFHNRYHFLMQLRDGKIIGGKEYADSAMMASFAKRFSAA